MKYIIIKWEEDFIDNESISEKLLFEYKDVIETFRGTLTIGVRLVYPSQPKFIKVVGDYWMWLNDDEEKRSYDQFYIEENFSYLFEAPDDDAAKLIFEVYDGN